jgi:hypothetical protein
MFSLRKKIPREWDNSCHQAFLELKSTLFFPPILKFPEFEIHTDTSDFTISGVLMQDGWPITYESKKLDDC